MTMYLFCQALAGKYLRKPKHRFYAAYIDFKKAFDSVDRVKLLYMLLQKGIHGKLYTVIENMYNNVCASVKVGNGRTDIFHTTSGVRQGCMLSPLLFIFFINQLALDFDNGVSNGIFVNEFIDVIKLLLFADDIVLVAASVVDLQRKLDLLEVFCDKWGLEVNLDKSNIIVFRNGGIVKSVEKWYYKTNVMKIVSY